MGHTDVVPVHARRLDRRTRSAASSSRNGDGVDEVWGRGAVDMLNLTSSMAVAFQDLVDARRSARRGDLHLLRRRRRGGRQRPRRPLGGRPPPRRDPLRLPADRERRAARRLAGGAGDRRRRSARRASPGAGCGCAARPATARCRSASTTRSSRRPPSCSASPSTARRRGSTSCGRRGSTRSTSPTSSRRALLDPDAIDAALDALPSAGGRRPPPRLHAHDVLAEPHRRRASMKTNVIPDSIDARGRRPHAARRGHRRGRRPPAGRARRPRRPRRGRDHPRTTRRRSAAPTRRCGTRCSGPSPCRSPAPRCRPQFTRRLHRRPRVPRARRDLLRRRPVQPDRRRRRVRPPLPRPRRAHRRREPRPHRRALAAGPRRPDDLTPPGPSRLEDDEHLAGRMCEHEGQPGDGDRTPSARSGPRGSSSLDRGTPTAGSRSRRGSARRGRRR